MWYSAVGCLVTLILSLLAVPRPVNAQRPAHMPRIGYLEGRSASDTPHLIAAFRHGLRELSYIEGQNIAMEYRYAEEKRERFPALAAELVQLPVDVIVTTGLAATQAAHQATTTIPIVQASGGDLVLAGLVASLAQPGGNITGLSIRDVEGGGKRLELLKEAVPHASRIAVLWNTDHPSKALEWHQTQEAAWALGVTLHAVEVRRPHDFDRAFAALTAARPDALITFTESLTIGHRQQIVDFAAQHQLPMMSEIKEFAEVGSLMTYGPSLPDLFRRAAYYVDRILKGAKAADLPVELPMRFALVINLKTAKALGITMSPSLLLLADEVLQ
jgi:ABC-type uncharacterized transport system substrate-binding protein